jgi:hypothetical protein
VLPTDGSCDAISILTVLEVVHSQLVRQHVETATYGVAPCIEGYDELAVGTYDWRGTTLTVELVADVLARYDIAGEVPVGVYAVHCAVPL